MVSWQQSNYAAIEGSVLSVCAVQPAQTEKAFNVTITAPPSEGVLILGTCMYKNEQLLLHCILLQIL